MHASLALAGAFAVGAFAVPSAHKHAHLHNHEKRDVVTVMDYDTQVVQKTVYVDGSQPSPPPKPQPHEYIQKPKKKVHADHYGGWGKPGNNNNQGGWNYFWGNNNPSDRSPAEHPKPKPHPKPEYQAPKPKPQPKPEYQAPKPKPKPQPKPQPKAPSNGGSNTYQKNCVDSHNVHRSNHSAPLMGWDDDLANAAQMLAKTCNWGHNTQLGADQCKWGGYGQNIAAGVSADDVAKVMNDMWYNGEIDYFNGMYGQDNPTSNFEQWGHFSQMIWKSSTSVGCATVDCTGQGDMSNYAQPAIYTVCNYGPAGNMGGDYAKNVQQPEGKPTVSGTKCHL